MDSFDDIPEQALAWHRDGTGAVLATVTQTWGSAPRRVGSMLAISGGGEIAGSVSGFQPVVSIPVVEARRDRRSRQLRSVTAVGLIVALTLLLYRVVTEVLPWHGLLDRFLPSVARS